MKTFLAIAGFILIFLVILRCKKIDYSLGDGVDITRHIPDNLPAFNRKQLTEMVIERVKQGKTKEEINAFIKDYVEVYNLKK